MTEQDNLKRLADVTDDLSPDLGASFVTDIYGWALEQREGERIMPRYIIEAVEQVRVFFTCDAESEAEARLKDGQDWEVFEEHVLEREIEDVYLHESEDK